MRIDFIALLVGQGTSSTASTMLEERIIMTTVRSFLSVPAKAGHRAGAKGCAGPTKQRSKNDKQERASTIKKNIYDLRATPWVRV